MSFREQEQRRHRAQRSGWIMVGLCAVTAGSFFVLLAKWAD